MQLAHACLALGFHAVIPASWGDELIAHRALERLRESDGPRVFCACPHVLHRLGADRGEIDPMLLRLVAPPVATAEYLRLAYAPSRPQITFAGDCPAGADDSIDTWLTVDALLQTLADRGIVVAEQPMEYDSVIPPDRRRFFSDVGGPPWRTALHQLPTPVELVELRQQDVIVDIAQHLLSGSRLLIDAAPAVGCTCAGARGDVRPDAARPRVREHEPPRAPSPIVDHALSPVMDVPSFPGLGINPSPGSPNARPPMPVDDPAPQEAPVAIQSSPRRRSPPGMPRPVLGASPVRRSDAGRQLPRAFVARRRSSPRSGLRQSMVRPSGATRRLVRGRWLWLVMAAAATAAVVALALLAR